jgi:hypothetical protein
MENFICKSEKKKKNYHWGGHSLQSEVIHKTRTPDLPGNTIRPVEFIATDLNEAAWDKGVGAMMSRLHSDLEIGS